MNSGFRNLPGRKDTSKFQAYLIAVAVQMILLPPMLELGMIRAHVPPFYPVSAVLGGFVFGLAMNWGGGCAGGVLYKAGSGSIGALVTLTTLILGYVVTEDGVLKPLRILVQSVPMEPLKAALPPHAFPPVIPASAGAVLLIYLLKKSPLKGNPGWSARKTGLIVGFVAIFAWLTSSLSGRFFGMAIVPGEKEAFDFLTLSETPGWDLVFVAGIPLGGYISARLSHEFKWSSIAGASIWKLAAGGFAMGTSASLAGGCTVGHSLTGVPLLSFQSLAFTVSAIAGAIAGALVPHVFGKKE